VQQVLGLFVDVSEPPAIVDDKDAVLNAFEHAITPLIKTAAGKRPDVGERDDRRDADRENREQNGERPDHNTPRSSSLSRKALRERTLNMSYRPCTSRLIVNSLRLKRRDNCVVSNPSQTERAS
jgi:hypothetical protein